jgi:hypothetical protein
MNLQKMKIHLSRRKKFSTSEERIRREHNWWRHEKLLVSAVSTLQNHCINQHICSYSPTSTLWRDILRFTALCGSLITHHIASLRAVARNHFLTWRTGVDLLNKCLNGILLKLNHLQRNKMETHREIITCF